MGKVSKTISISYSPAKDKELVEMWKWLKSHCQKEQIPLKEGLLRALRKYKNDIMMMEAMQSVISEAIKLMQGQGITSLNKTHQEGGCHE